MIYSKKHGLFLLGALFLALILCSTASAANTSVNNTTQIADPIISGTVTQSPSNTGLSGVSIRVETTGGNLLAETTTGTNGTYSMNFTSSDTAFQVTASKVGYISYTKQVTVSSVPNSSVKQGTANFTLYMLPDYSGDASSYVLNLGVLPQILLDLYAAKSSSWVNSTSSPYASSMETPLEVKLLSGDLLAGLLTVNSTGDQGTKTGGITSSNLPSLLKALGLDVGLFNGTAYSSTHPPQASGQSGVASIGLNLLGLLKILNVNLIGSNSSVTPNFQTGVLTSTSSSGVADISLLGGLLEIKALKATVTASVNGQPGGATANFDYSIADILLNGHSILGELKANLSVTLPGILKIALGGSTKTISPDGTYAKVSGDVLTVQLLNVLLGGVTLTIGHVDAEAKGNLNGADLGIRKTVDNATPKYLQNVTFTLTAQNYGPSNATGVTVTDKLPSGLKFVSANGNGSYNPTTGVWTIGNLANGANSVLKIVAQVTASNVQITNIASILGTQNDQNSSNNQASVTITVPAASDLTMTKTVNTKTPRYLDNVTFTLTVHNNGPDTATGVSVADKLPAGLLWVSDDSSGAYNPTTGLWTIGSLANGANAVLTLVAKVNVSNAQLTNTAVVSGTNYDQNSTNNQGSVTITVGPASDLGITKKANKTTVNYLQNVIFTLTVHNYGPNNATGVTVNDKLPTGLSWVSDNSNGAYNSTTGVWTIGNLANGANAVLNITAKATAANVQLTNIATTNETNYDQNSTNNQGSTTITVPAASDLSVTKSVNNSTPKYLDNVTFTLTVNNFGPSTATGVSVADKLPAGLLWVSDDSSGAYNPTTGLWTIGSLANGANAVLHIIAKVNVANVQLTNTAITNESNYDQNSTNNQGNSTITVPAASDLGITKTVSNATPKYLDNVTFTLTAHNYGPNAATGVTVNDKLPTGLSWVSDDSNNAYNPTTGLWTIGTLANGANAILHIVARATTADVQVTNVAVVNGTNYDQNPCNNQAIVIVKIGAYSDLGIHITVNNATPKVLEDVTFTITAYNHGPSDAPNVKVYVTMPSDLRYVSDDSNGKYNATYNATTGLWSVGYMANGATAVLHIVAQAMVANVQLTTVVRITDPDPAAPNNFYDPNPSNDNANVTINPYSAQQPSVSPPMVTSTNPASNGTGFSLTSPITITFSKSIQAGANFSEIYIKNLTTGKIVTIGSKTINGNTLTIQQANSRLSKNTYQVYIPAGAVKDLAGKSLATAYTYQFQTV